MKILLKQPYSFHQLGKRANQEDARFPDEDAPQDYKSAYVVCDGVGGQEKGEIASRIIANAIGEEMQKADLSVPFTVNDFESVMSEAYSVLKRSMKEYGSGMATTMTFVCFHSAGTFVAHIGDSRIYHVRPGVGILYKSDDHSLVDALVHSGNLTPEEAENHPQSNIITRCIGKISSNGNGPSIDTYQISDVEPNDYFFLCSDGVCHCLGDQQLFAILSSPDSDNEKINTISSICDKSSDNNTAYLIGIEDVIYDETEISTMSCNDTNGKGQNTTPLNVPNEVIVESSIKNHLSIVGQISDFFSKLF
ncbi:MAG: protein phosphatase 2C domain-containing protein [Muribaculum sp.]|nr:protein phosphatase 2C domain-containing protein [Muribaculum sp.]